MKIISQYSKHENDLIPSNSYIWIDLSKFSIDPCKEIEQLFASWLNNRKLCEFLQAVQSIIFSLSIPKEFQLIELRENQKTIKKNVVTIGINLKKDIKNYNLPNFLYHNSCQYFESKKKKFKHSKEFPYFQYDSNCELSCNYFKILKESWTFYHETQTNDQIEFNLDFDTIIEENTIKEKKLYALLKKLYENLNLYYEPEDSIDVCLKLTNIWPQKNPLIFFSYLISSAGSNVQINPECLNVIEAIGVVISLRNQAIRCIKYANQKETMRNYLKKELINVPFKNWSPKKNPEWLLIQLELDIIIRESQIDVVNTMISPPNNQNTVIQMNMGEGKTSVIIPLLLATLADGNHLVRLIVLKSLMNMNYNSLVFKLGRLLNKRIYLFPFNREIDTEPENMKIYFDVLNECKENKHVALTMPEYCLSFKLKTIEMCRLENKKEAKKLIEIEKWLIANVKDILDESDEILTVKYQLVYSVGRQAPLDGGKLRWEISQDVLELARRCLSELKKKYPESIELNEISGSKQSFPSIRLLNMEPYNELIKKICYYFFNRIGVEPDLPQYTSKDIDQLTEFVIEKEISETTKLEIEKLCHPKDASPSTTLKEILLILRGILSHDILFTVLNKRWKVEYGINSKSHLMQAVPYRAKDVPSERSQFAHPDILIMLTYLSYYYSGLNDLQLNELFKQLENDVHSEHVYNKWIELLPEDVEIEKSVKEFASLNLSDSNQKTNILFPLLRSHPPVINNWLSSFLFPKEAKEFSNKLSTSAWDLCSLNKNLTTGFSGTNDSSRYLSPLNMNYYDLPNLIGTTGNVISNILSEKNSYGSLLTQNEHEILESMIKDKINVLLDVGALMVRLSNRQVALNWLNLTNDEIEAVVFFQNNDLVVMMKNTINEINSFETSAYRNNLKKCLIYLDDIHTRGTDIKIPINTTAAVTLGKGLDKDRLFQACMRMRMLGDGHCVKFYASKEVNNEIIRYCDQTYDPITSENVLNWAIHNSIKMIKNASIYWAYQGLSFYLRKAAYENNIESIQLNFSQYFETCKELNLTKLSLLYESSRKENLILDIVKKQSKRQLEKFRSSKMNSELFEQNAEKISTKLLNQIPKLRKYDQLLDEEMELEIEKEAEEEMQIERPNKAKFKEPYLDEEVKNFATKEIFQSDSSSFNKLIKSLVNSSFYDLVDENAWSNQIYVTRDFIQTVQTYDFDDYYLRIPRWILIKKVENNESIFVIISSFEADSLFFSCKKNVGLYMFMPRVKHNQRSILFPFIELDPKIRLQISIFCGSFYFEDENEQKIFNLFVGYLPSPRNPDDQEKFDQKLISANGFVLYENRQHVFKNEQEICRFEKDPSAFIIKLIEIRNFAIIPKTAHHLMIFLNGKKPFQ